MSGHEWTTESPEPGEPERAVDPHDHAGAEDAPIQTVDASYEVLPNPEEAAEPAPRKPLFRVMPKNLAGFSMSQMRQRIKFKPREQASEEETGPIAVDGEEQPAASGGIFKRLTGTVRNFDWQKLPLANARRETRVGVAALLSFVVLVSALVLNHNSSKKKDASPAPMLSLNSAKGDGKETKKPDEKGSTSTTGTKASRKNRIAPDDPVAGSPLDDSKMLAMADGVQQASAESPPRPGTKPAPEKPKEEPKPSAETPPPTTPAKPDPTPAPVPPPTEPAKAPDLVKPEPAKPPETVTKPTEPPKPPETETKPATDVKAPEPPTDLPPLNGAAKGEVNKPVEPPVDVPMPAVPAATPAKPETDKPSTVAPIAPPVEPAKTPEPAKSPETITKPVEPVAKPAEPAPMPPGDAKPSGSELPGLPPLNGGAKNDPGKPIEQIDIPLPGAPSTTPAKPEADKPGTAPLAPPAAPPIEPVKAAEPTKQPEPPAKPVEPVPNPAEPPKTPAPLTNPATEAKPNKSATELLPPAGGTTAPPETAPPAIVDKPVTTLPVPETGSLPATTGDAPPSNAGTMPKLVPAPTTATPLESQPVGMPDPSVSDKPARSTLPPGAIAIRNLGKHLPDELEAEEQRVAPAPKVADAPLPREAGPAAVDPILHTVEPNENFWTISKLYYNSGRYYRALHSANRKRVPDIRTLYVGTVVKVPPIEELDPTLIDPPSPAPARSVSSPSRTRAAEDTPRTAARRDQADLDTATTPTLGRGRPRERLADADEVAQPTYKVRKHDTLRSIARDTLGDSRRYREILQLNRDVIDDPTHLTSGQVLTLPDDATVGRQASR